MSTPALAQTKHGARTLTGEQWDQVKPLFKLVEEVADGAPPPTDVKLSWQCHFLKAESKNVLTLFSLKMERGEFTSPPVAMYLRVVRRGARAPAPGPRDPLAQYPFEDATVFDEPKDGRFSRAFVAPAGDYDVYVALRERPDADTTEPRTVVVKQTVTVPDLWSDFAVSSVIVLDMVEVEPQVRQLNFEEQLDEPYTWWGTKMTPALVNRFRQRGKLSVVFLVYNTGAAANDKPDVQVEYNFYQKTGTTDGKTGAVEKYFGSTSPQSFNARTLRPEFSLTAGDLIIAGQDMPLTRFPLGDYRLEIKVTDKTTGKSLSRDVDFTAAGS